MSESTTESKEPKKSLGGSLVDIGKKIEDLSANEVSNKKVITSLAVIGVVELGAMVGITIEGTRNGALGSALSNLAVKASEIGDNYQSMNLYGAASEAHRNASNEFFNVATDAALIAVELATVAGIEMPKYYKEGNGLIELNGKTKVSTHVGPALSNIFIKCGEYFDKKPS